MCVAFVLCMKLIYCHRALVRLHTRQEPEVAVESQEEDEAVGLQELEGVVEPQVQGHESERQYEALNLNSPLASGSHKQQGLVQSIPVITRSGRVSKPPNRF